MISGLKDCKVPNYELLKDEEEFNGVVKTIVNSKKNLCFIVREEDFLRLKKFEEFQSKEPLRKLGHLPKAHMVSMYHFKERNKFYRAYTLTSNVCDANTRLFFMDTGEVVYGLLKVSNFYMLPDDLFDFQSLAYFCRIQNLVDIMKAKDIVMTFKVKKNSSFFKRPLYDLSRERCLVLDVVNPPTFEVEPTLNNSVISVYSSFESSKVSIEDLTKSQKIIEKGTMIVVYRDVIYDEKSMYAHILTLEDLKDFQMLNENNIDEGYNLRMWLANDSIKMNLPKLDESPKINDVVIFQDSMLRASRALVKRISPDKTKFELFFIDYGLNQIGDIKNLRKLPAKCGMLPPQCVFLTLTNLDLDQNRNLKTLKSLPKILMAKVESTTLVNSQHQLHVKLYTTGGQSAFSGE